MLSLSLCGGMGRDGVSAYKSHEGVVVAYFSSGPMTCFVRVEGLGASLVRFTACLMGMQKIVTPLVVVSCFCWGPGVRFP